MLTSHKKKFTLVIVLCGVLIIFAGTLLARGGIVGQTQQIFDGAFATKVTDGINNPILRVRNGSETFCIQEAVATKVPAGKLISDLSDAFNLDWKQIHVADLADCPAGETVFYVLRGERPDQTELLDLIEGIVGSRPPDPSSIFPEWARGLSVSLPGPGGRELVFASYGEGMPHDVANSILSEELLQSILRASDVPSTEIVSLLGEDLRDKDYAQWFHNNPMGFCSVDIVLLELLLGPSTTGLHKMDEMRAHLTSNFDELLEAAESRSLTLADYRDPRCWVWDAP